MPVDENDIIRVACRQRYASVDEVVNVYHVVCLTNETANDQGIGDDLADIFGQVYVEIEGLLSSALEPNVIDVYNVTQDYPIGQFNWGGGYNGGTGGGSELPSGVAGLVIWNTNVKRMQGKTYIGVLTESSLTDGIWNAAYLSDMTAFVGAMLDFPASLSSSTYQFEIYSRENEIVRHPTGFRIPLEPAYQRRRRRGRGS